MSGKVALVTGAAHRVGAEIVRTLHGRGMNVVVHYRSSHADAAALRDALNAIRADSVTLVQGDLNDTAALSDLAAAAAAVWGRLDVLVNNASGFYPTPLETASEAQWDDLLGSNLKGPFFLSRAAAPHLVTTSGSIVNIVDIHAERPLKDYPIYCIAKAGLVMATKALARELGPAVRVNAVAPGSILWPEHDLAPEVKQAIIERTALKRQGEPADIAGAVAFLAGEAGYVTGQVLAVDGGRTLSN